MQPQIDLGLLASPFCFLSREREFNIWLKFRLHYPEPVAVITTGSIFDPAATFIKSRIEIQGIETGENIYFPTQSSANENTRSGEPALILEPERGSYFFWSTTPGMKWREYPFDISGLSPNRKYSVSYRDHGFTEWSPVSQPARQEPRLDVEVQSEPIAVNLLGDRAPSFTTRQALPPKPPVTSSLSTSTPICSLSGVTSLTIFLDWKLDGDRPICALMTRGRGQNIGVEIRDPERKGRRIGPPSDVICYDEDELPPNEEELLRLDRGDPFRQSHTLTVEPKHRLLNADT